ncbi:MAG: hypothetical protein RBR15_05835 [Sphaerochaeta sp.]|nr:hypothetical protein [Sphaerochaeta sp.]
MEIPVEKWENGLGLRIPAVYCKEWDLQEGTVIDLSRTTEGLLITPQKKSRRDELERLLSQINPKNMHTEEFFT